MIDIKILREDPDRIKQEVKNRNKSIDVDKIIELDEKKRLLQSEVEELKAKRNQASDEIAKLKGKEKESRIAEMKELADKSKGLEANLKELEAELNHLLAELPNLSHESVPVGKDETENQVIDTWGEKPDFDFKPKSHEELGQKLDLIDTERATKVSGSRFSFLKNDLVKLQFAIVRWLLDFLDDKGFQFLLPPVLVKRKAMFGTGFFPADENEVFKVNPDDDKLFLVGTAEVPLASYHANETIDVSKPLMYAAYSSSFRREAGAYGKDQKGIFRQHQFDKIEMFVYSNQDDSWDIYEQLLGYSLQILQHLELPYQQNLMCTGDLSAPNAKRIDPEAWFPSQNKYRELQSASHDTDFQARRLNIKYKDKDGSRKYVHTLNSTAIAFGRTMACLLENHQTKDGKVKVPEVLRPYFGQDYIGETTC